MTLTYPPPPPITVPRLYSVHINIDRDRTLRIGYNNKKTIPILIPCRYYNNLASRFVCWVACGAEEAKIYR